MNPTAISQVIEAIGKMIFGIAAAKLTITYGSAPAKLWFRSALQATSNGAFQLLYWMAKMG